MPLFFCEIRDNRPFLWVLNLMFHRAQRMRSLHLPKLTNPKLHCYSSHVHFHNSQTLNPHAKLKYANALSKYIVSCQDPKVLLQIHTHMLRLNLLSSPNHYNSLMRSYIRNSHPIITLFIFTQMNQLGLHPNLHTLALSLKASSVTYSFYSGVQIHGISIKHGLNDGEFTETGVISFYAKMGFMESARKVFNENTNRKIGSWNAMINGLCQCGFEVEVVELSMEMMRCGVVPDELTMVSIVSACGRLGRIGLAEQVHKLALQVKCIERLEITVSNSLLDMYCKCGHTDKARKIFKKMPLRDVSSWNTMITGLGTHGKEKLAIDFFQTMIHQGISPDHITMVAVLSACAHGGLIDKGMHYLKNMKEIYKVEPKEVHYGCVIDMLGRVGRTKEAREVAEKMPMGQNTTVFGTLLGASEKNGDVEVAEWAAKNWMELEPWDGGVYVALSHVYAKVGKWDEVEKMRKAMKQKKIAKISGYSAFSKGL